MRKKLLQNMHMLYELGQLFAMQVDILNGTPKLCLDYQSTTSSRVSGGCMYQRGSQRGSLKVFMHCLWW